MSGARILSTWSFARPSTEAAWPALAAGGDPLDAAESICRAIEADEGVDSVGYGGLPDAEGRVTLDGLVMRSPSEVGAVAAVSTHLHVATIARAVMERTPHVLLAGTGAETFADAVGVPRRALLAPPARARWEAWRDGRAGAPDQSRDTGRRTDVRPVDDGRGGRLFEGGHDTICTLVRGADGRLAGASSTSGLPYKHPGRVGDAPIPGHGLYVDPSAGAAAATGAGELAMGGCASFLAVERMRGGAAPTDALVAALERLARDHALADTDQLAMIAMTPDGAWGAAALRPGYRTVVADEDGVRVVEPDAVVLPEA